VAILIPPALLVVADFLKIAERQLTSKSKAEQVG